MQMVVQIHRIYSPWDSSRQHSNRQCSNRRHNNRQQVQIAGDVPAEQFQMESSARNVGHQDLQKPDGPVPADRKATPENSAPTAERRNRRRADPGPAAAARRIRAISVPTAERNARMPFGPAPADRKIKETSARTAENRDSKKCKLPGCLLGQMGSLSQIQGEKKWHL